MHGGALLQAAGTPARRGWTPDEREQAVIWAKRLYDERRRRDRLFPPSLFGEPSWDVLLSLLIARERGKPLILAEAYRRAGVTDTTGRRLLDRLEREQMVSRRRAPRCRKTRLVELTETGFERMMTYLTP